MAWCPSRPTRSRAHLASLPARAGTAPSDRSGAALVGRGHLEEDVVGFRLADGDADPVRAVRADHDPRRLGLRTETLALRPEGEPHEVALCLRHRPAQTPELVHHACSLFHDRLEALQ